MALDTWLAGNTALGIALAALLGSLLLANRSFLRDIAGDPDVVWRRLLAVAGVLVAVLVVWTTVFDNWRQLIEEPLRQTKRFTYQRVVLDPTPEALRAVTLTLLIVSLLPVAALFARHVGGYVLQLSVLLGATILWAPLFAMRRRLDLNLALGIGGDERSPLDLMAYGLYVLFDWLTVSTLLLVTFAALTMLVALPLTLLLDLTSLRHPRTTTEARDFFSDLAGRASLTAAEGRRGGEAGRRGGGEAGRL